MLDHALSYLARGLPVFPVCGVLTHQHRDSGGAVAACVNPGKVPLVNWKAYQTLLPTEAQVRNWWGRWPDANIGMATGELSKVVVLDLDGELACREALARGYDHGPHAFTGRIGGQHRYFAWRTDAPRNFAKKLGIDFRGEGGYVVLPPSRHKNGNTYTWGEPLGDEYPELPYWVDDMATRVAPGGRAGVVDDVIPEHERNTTLASLAGSMRRRGMTETELVAALRAVNTERCQPPLDDAEVQQIAHSVASYAPSSSATHVADVEWPTPAGINGPPPPPVVPLDCFPTQIIEHACDIAERMQCPIDYVVWTLLVTVSTVIGRSVGIRPKRQDDWTERPALWVALIGDPSSMKTPGMNAGVRLLHALSARLREEYRIAMEVWRSACAAARQTDAKHPDLPAEPQLRWLVVDDATTEKMSDLLQPEISRGLVFVRDEVSGLIRELERYRSRAGDREFLLQAYSGGPKSVARISRPPVFVPDLLLNIVGGIQPDVAREVFASGADDGLGARFLAIWPALPATFVDVDRFPNKELRDAFDLVAKKLYVADWSKLLITDDFSPVPYCRVTQAAHDVFSAWRSRIVLSTRGDSPRYEHRFGRRVGKYPGVAARIALVLHLFEEAAAPTAREAKANIATVDTNVMERVTRLMDDYVLPMEERVYAEYGVAPEAEGARRIARWIREVGPSSFTAREVRRHGWSNLDEPLKVAAALEWLCSRGWLREADAQKRVGRPSDVFLVNPRVGTEGGD